MNVLENLTSLSIREKRGKYSRKGTPKVYGYLFKLRRSHDSENANLSRHVTHAWSRRFFTIERDMLKWYRDDTQKKVSGIINFHEILSIRILNCESRFEDKYNRDEFGTYSFQINAQSRKLVLRVVARKDAKLWVDHLRNSLKQWTNRSGKETLNEINIEKRKNSLSGDEQFRKRIEHTMNQIDQAEKQYKQPKNHPRFSKKREPIEIETKTEQEVERPYFDDSEEEDDLQEEKDDVTTPNINIKSKNSGGNRQRRKPPPMPPKPSRLSNNESEKELWTVDDKLGLDSDNSDEDDDDYKETLQKLNKGSDFKSYDSIEAKEEENMEFEEFDEDSNEVKGKESRYQNTAGVNADEDWLEADWDSS